MKLSVPASGKRERDERFDREAEQVFRYWGGGDYVPYGESDGVTG